MSENPHHSTYRLCNHCSRSTPSYRYHLCTLPHQSIHCWKLLPGAWCTAANSQQILHANILLLYLQYGFFCYAVQSFASQLIDHPELYADDTGIWARSTRMEMLKLSGECFRHALDLEGTKHAEPWIYWMMLGKIGAKLGKPITETLRCLSKVSMLHGIHCCSSMNTWENCVYSLLAYIYIPLPMVTWLSTFSPQHI